MILQWAGSRFGYVAAVHCISLLAAHLGKIHTLLNESQGRTMLMLRKFI